jgi:hypothetical protein
MGAIAYGSSVRAQTELAQRERFVVGIQTHAHDFVGEGMDHVLGISCEKAGVNCVLTCATYVKENMRLPHNPRFSRYPTQGGVYFDYDPKLYADSEIKPIRTPEKEVAGFDAVREVAAACKKKGLKFYAWVSSFNYPQEGPLYPQHQVMAANGQRKEDWLCPNSPEARKFSLKVYEDIVRNCEIDGVFVDRFRFPDDITTCFCPHCTRAMKERDLDHERIRRGLVSIAAGATGLQQQALLSLGMSIDPVFYIPGLPELAEFVRFKMDTINSYVESLYKLVKSVSPQVEVGLDMFSPSVAWQVGQEPRALVNQCDWIKPMAYHLGDGYHAIRAIRTMAETGAADPQQVYQGLKGLLAAKGMTLPDSFDEFQKTSFPVTWVQTEMELARTLTEAKKPLYAGLQLWPPATPEIVADEIKAAANAKSNGIFLYCYGWAPLDNLVAAGRTLKELAYR